MASKYSRGYQFEIRIRKYFESLGWTVYRSSGSHGAADLLCAKGGEIVAVQCQTNSYFAPAKVEALREQCREHRWQGRLAWRDEKNKIQFKEL